MKRTIVKSRNLLAIIYLLLFLITGCSSTNTETTAATPTITVANSYFTWKNWYLSVPINDGTGSASNIYYSALETANFTLNQKEFVWKNSDESYTFKARFTGFTTSGEAGLDQGKYCRTELREFWKGIQSTEDNWLMSTGTHVLESKLKVDNINSITKELYVAQIHGKGGNDPATVKVLWKDGKLYIEHYTKPMSGTEWTSDYIVKPLIGNIGNSLFTIKLKVENGKLFYGLFCQERGLNIAYTELYDYAINGYPYHNYFKTGNYFRNNKDYSSSAQVTIYEIITSHS